MTTKDSMPFDSAEYFDGTKTIIYNKENNYKGELVDTLWKKIDNTEGEFSVSKCGKVKDNSFSPAKTVRQHRNDKGQKQCKVIFTTGAKNVRVDILVAQAFPNK